MALPGNEWQAVISWVNSGEMDVTTRVYFGGPYGSPPASGSLPYWGEIENGLGSATISMGTNPTHGVYYCQVTHYKGGYPESDFSPVTPLGVDSQP